MTNNFFYHRVLWLLVPLLTLFNPIVRGAQIASLEPENGKSFIIALYSNNKYYALPANLTNTGATPAGLQCTLNASNQVTAISGCESPDECLWYFESATGGFNISYVDAEDTKRYLYKNGTTGDNYNISANASYPAKSVWAFTAGTVNSVTVYSVKTTKSDATKHTVLKAKNSTSFQVNGTSNAYAITLLAVAPTGPTITKSSSMTTLTYSNGSPVAQSFTVGGTNLTHNVTVTAPTDYEVCLTENGTYTSSVELSKGSGTLSNTTVYIRLQAGLSAGNISSRNISLESEGATTQTIAVTGSVPYTITWMANGNTHATTYVAVGSTLALPASNPVPSSCGCTGKVFYGWYGLGTSYSNASVAPTIAAAGDAVSADKTYYAVFADAEEGDPVYTKVASITAGTYVMVSMKTSNTYRYMPNTTSDSSNPSLGNGITMSTTAGVTTLTNTVTSAMLWDFTTGETSGYYYVRPHGSTTIGLGTTNSTGGNIRIGSDWKDEEWRFATSANYGWEIYNGAHYLSAYSDSEWRNYSNNYTNQNGTFYMFKQSGGVTYSNYATTCCTNLGSINGSFF